MTRKFLLALVAVQFSVNAAYAEVPGIRDGHQINREIAGQVHDIDTVTLRRELERNPNLLLIDIRTPGEIEGQGGAIKAARNVNIPRGWLEFRVTDHAASKDMPIVVYCGGNIRSPLAAHTLKQMGYTNVRNYADGYIGWRRQGLPIE